MLIATLLTVAVALIAQNYWTSSDQDRELALKPVRLPIYTKDLNRH